MADDILDENGEIIEDDPNDDRKQDYKLGSSQVSENFITKGSPGLRERARAHSMAEAIRLAMHKVRDPDALEDDDPDPYGYFQELENNFGLNILDPKWKSYPDEPLWNGRLKRRARRAAVAALYLNGLTAEDIARRVKVSEVTVYKDIAAVSQEWRQSYLADMEVLAARDLARLDHMFSKLAPAIERGDVKAVLAGVEVIRERGNILGYRQGVQVDIEQHIKEVAAANGFDPEKAIEIAQKIKVRYKG